MIIYMRKGANRIMAEYVVGIFQRRGLDVYIKNGDGKFTLVVIGSEDTSTNGIMGIDRVEASDKLFFSRRKEFVLAEKFFRD